MLCVLVQVLVSALKNGETFVAYLGGLTAQHVELKTKLCKKVTVTHCA